jgi:hypothetical protein
MFARRTLLSATPGQGKPAGNMQTALYGFDGRRHGVERFVGLLVDSWQEVSIAVKHNGHRGVARSGLDLVRR